MHALPIDTVARSHGAFAPKHGIQIVRVRWLQIPQHVLCDTVLPRVLVHPAYWIGRYSRLVWRPPSASQRTAVRIAGRDAPPAETCEDANSVSLPHGNSPTFDSGCRLSKH